MSRRIPILLAAAALLALSGCAPQHSRQGAGGGRDLPGEMQAADGGPGAALPKQLPRSGVALVPEENLDGRLPIGDKEKAALLAKVAAEFLARPDLKSVGIIPSAYLSPGAGFENLERIRGLFGIDIIALLSCDRVRHAGNGTSRNPSSPGARDDDATTLLQVSFFRIQDRQLLFRVTGAGRGSGEGEPPGHGPADGMAEASENLLANLKTELEAFRARGAGNGDAPK